MSLQPVTFCAPFLLRHNTMDHANSSVTRCDALVIGAGFSGIATLYRLRKLGLNAKIFEAGDQFGGTWHWNRYPGARVDSEFPWYQLNIPELYTSWTFKERYPDHRKPHSSPTAAPNLSCSGVFQFGTRSSWLTSTRRITVLFCTR